MDRRANERASEAGHREEGAAPRESEAPEAWTAPPRRRARTAFISFVAMTVLGASGWLVSGHLLEKEARQRVADRYEALRICLVGDSGRLAPSEQLRLARLAVEHSPDGVAWPARCLPFAAAFEEALEARAVPAALRALPPATKIVEAPLLRSRDLDEIAAAVERADLPLPAGRPDLATAPPAVPPRLRAHQLEAFGSVERLDEVVTAYHPGGRDAPPGLRLLVPDEEGLRICRLDGDLGEIRCRTTPIHPPAAARLELAAAPEGAADLVQVSDAGDADGFYDGATGLPVWRSFYFDTQAVVSASGGVTLVSGELRGDARGERLERFELVRIAPGKRPRASRLPIPSDARVMLLPDVLLHWRDGERHATLTALGYDDEKISPGSVAELERGSRGVDHCRDRGEDAILFASGTRDRSYTIVRRQGDRFTTTSVGVIAGRVELSCHGDEAILERIREGVATRWRCEERCVQETTGALRALEAPVADVGSVGRRLVLLWADEGGPLRMRIGAPGELAALRDVLVLDTPDHGGMRLASLRIIDRGGLALVLLQDASLRLHALRIDQRGEVTPVRPVE